MNGPVKPALVLLLAALALAGCDGRLGYRARLDAEERFELPPGVEKVLIEIGEGSLTVLPGAPGVLVYQTVANRFADTPAGLATLEAIPLRPQAVQPEPGVLRLRGPELPAGLDPMGHRLITKVIVEIPPEIAVAGRTGFGHMSVTSRHAGVLLETRNGALQLDDCQGDAVLRTGRGAVIVQGHRGGLDMKSGQCETVQIFLDEIGPSGIRVETEEGGVQAHLPADASFVLDAETTVGRAKNGFGIPVERVPGTEQGRSMRGEVGGGGPLFFLRAVQGNISVRARGQR